MRRIRQEICEQAIREAYLVHMNGPAPSLLRALRHVMSCADCKDLIGPLLEEIRPEELFDDSSQMDELESALSAIGYIVIVKL